MLLLAGACILLYVVNPMEAAWLPKCTFYMTTGYKCPACGLTRAMHALLHGQFYAAFMYNPLAVVTLPLAAIILWRDLHYEKSSFKVSQRWLWAFIIIMLVWWVVRNIIGV